MFEIGDLLFLFGDLFFSLRDRLLSLGQLLAERLILLRQSLNLLGLAIRDIARAFAVWQPLLPPRRHQPKRTESIQKVQAP